jgi:hypothetical protein
MKFLTKPMKAFLVAFLMIGAVSFAQTNVSDAELGKFANAFKGIQEVSMNAESQLIEVIENSGLELTRFNELYNASQNGQVKPAGASEDEAKKFDAVMGRMQAMQPVFEKQVDDAIAKAGISSERYEEIMAAVQSDPSLQQKMQSMLE